VRAYVLIRDQPWYRRSVFVAGLRAAGFDVELRAPDKPDRNTLLLIWNRYANNHDLANRVEAAGGRVLVAENGYLGRGGGTPKFEVHPAGPQPHHYYAISSRFHNDDTLIRSGDTDRFAALNVTLKPWRTGGDYILVCPNRSFGVPSRMMPPDWAERRQAQLARSAGCPVRVRVHPGNNAPKRALADDLAGARAVYIWSSSCGVHALAEGIPVIADAPYWIAKNAARGERDDNTREAAFHRLAWAQWTCEEIAHGDPFTHLLSPTL